MSTVTMINATCHMCHVTHQIVVPEDGYNAWAHGVAIQVALPSLSADDRELLISDTCGPCFDKLFGMEGDMF